MTKLNKNRIETEASVKNYKLENIPLYSIYRYAKDQNARIKRDKFYSEVGLELLNKTFTQHTQVNKNVFHDLDNEVVYVENYKNHKLIKLELIVNGEIYTFNHNLRLTSGEVKLKSLLELVMHFVGFAADSVSSTEKYDAIFAENHPFSMIINELKTKIFEDKIKVSVTLKTKELKREDLIRKWANLEEKAVMMHQHKQDNYSDSVKKSKIYLN